MNGRPLRLAARRCLLRAWLPTAVAALAALVGGSLHAAIAPTFAAGALSPWLQLAPFVAAVACGIAAIDYWPLLASGRPGADFVLRATPPPLHGCGVAVLGALVAMTVLLLPMAAIAAPLLPEQHAHVRLLPTGRALLEGATTEIEFRADGVACAELQLRPAALLPPGDLVATTFDVLGDGRSLVEAPIEALVGRRLVRVATGGRTFSTLTVRRTGGTLPLLFDRDSVIAVDAAPRSRLAASAMAFLLYLVPTAVALAVAMLLAPFVTLPVAFVVVAAAMALQVFAELGPAAAGMALCARGQWLAGEAVFRASIPSLGTGLAAMIGAMIVRSRAHR